MEEGGDFHSGPLNPGVEAGGEFDNLGDVGASDAGCRFEEVEAAVGVRLDELCVGDAGDEAERFDDVSVDAGEAHDVAGLSVESAGAEDSSLMHGLHGWLAILEGGVEEDLAVPGDAFDVKDIPGHEPLQQVVGLEVSELVEDGPESVGGFDFADADG